MASNNETTTKFKVDISELKQAMQEAKRAVAVANSEFKEAASNCDDWTKSSTGLSAKLKQLDTTLSSQKTILGALEKQYEAVVKEQGEGSKAADDLKIKINNQKAAINNTQREMGKYEQTLQEVAEAEKVAAKTGQDVAEVLADVGEEAKEAGDGFTIFKGAVATFAGNAMTSLVGGIKNGISSLVNLGTETREYRTELGKLETAFTTAGFTTEAATKTYKDLYAVLGDEGQSVEAANMLAKMADTQEELAEWTDIATGVYGTFGSSLPIESLAEAANETSKTGALTGALADALNWAGVNEEDFQASLDGCTTEQERQALITETLNGLYSDAAKEYKKTNKSVMDANKAQSDYNDTMAAMGAKIEPVMTTVKEGFNGLLQEALKLVEDVDFEAFSKKIEEAFKVLREDVLPAIKDGLGWIIKNKGVIVAGLSAIAAGFVAFKVASLIQSVTTALQGMSVAQAALNLVMSANPIGLIITLVAGLVAGFVALWNNCEGFRNFFTGLWDGLKNIVGGAVEAISGFFSGLWDGIKNIFGGIGSWFGDKFKSAKENSEKAWEKAGEVWSGIKDKVTGAFSKVGDFFKGKFTEAKENSEKAWEMAGKVWTGIKDKVTGAFSKVGDWFKGKFKEAQENSVNAWSKAKELFTGIKDKVTGAFSNVGSWFKTKFKEAQENSVKAWDNIKEKFSSVKDKVTGAFSNVGSWFKDKFKEAQENSLNAWSNVKEKFSDIKDKITGAFSNLGSKLKETFSNALNKAKEGFNKIKDIGSDIVKGLWNGISNMTSWIKEKISGFGESVLGGIKDFFGINSPSKLMADEVGKWIPEGIAVGIDKNAKSVLDSMRDVTTGVVGAARDGLTTGGVMSGSAGIVNNFYQTNNSPKALSRLEIYRQSKNLLGYAGGV